MLEQSMDLMQRSGERDQAGAGVVVYGQAWQNRHGEKSWKGLTRGTGPGTCVKERTGKMDRGGDELGEGLICLPWLHKFLKSLKDTSRFLFLYFYSLYTQK